MKNLRILTITNPFTCRRPFWVRQNSKGTVNTKLLYYILKIVIPLALLIKGFPPTLPCTVLYMRSVRLQEEETGTVNKTTLYMHIEFACMHNIITEHYAHEN